MEGVYEVMRLMVFLSIISDQDMRNVLDGVPGADFRVLKKAQAATNREFKHWFSLKPKTRERRMRGCEATYLDYLITLQFRFAREMFLV